MHHQNPSSPLQVVIRCRMNQRLSCLKELSASMKKLPPAEKGFDCPLISSFRRNLLMLVTKACLIEFIPRGEN